MFLLLWCKSFEIQFHLYEHLCGCIKMLLRLTFSSQYESTHYCIIKYVITIIKQSFKSDYFELNALPDTNNFLIKSTFIFVIH